MNSYITGAVIKKLREEKQMTQAELADRLSVSDKAVSRWETGRGYPDISLVEPLAAALGISVIELLSGADIINRNRSFNMRKVVFYVCPVCGNVIVGTGEAVVSCCGIVLPPMEASEEDDMHSLLVEKIEDEYYAVSQHPMTKDHYISFIAAVRDNGVEIVKLYPEGNAEASFRISRTRDLYFCCNRHGLFRKKLPLRPGSLK